MTSRVLGIDLGTTNSTVATIDEGRATPLTIEQNCAGETIASPLVPSAVAIMNGKPVVGHAAARLRHAPAEFGLEPEISLFHETKNDIGLDKTYYRAPDGYRTPAEIAGHVLGALKEHAGPAGDTDRIVVTVPASFQTSQRAETVRAAALAGIDLAPGDLLDEPVAVFIDKYVENDGEPFNSNGDSTILVFDFGGGTCDVAIFKVAFTVAGAPDIAPLAVSRYHRLGGGDIDRAIIHEVLIPQLLEQNGLDRFALDATDKTDRFEPALLTIAEQMKIQLCANPKLEGATIARTLKFSTEVAELTLRDPALTREQFDEVLEPFLDRDLLFEAGLEYRTQLSIFAPIEDALDRAGLGRDEIDYVLLAGGSSLIPEVGGAIANAFANATMIGYDDPVQAQTAVARGAAYQAAALERTGEGIVTRVTHESISLRTADGLLEIVPRGVELPYPSEAQWERIESLTVPESCAVGSLELRIEVVAGAERHPLDMRIWEIPAPVVAGESLHVDVCLDENQVLQLSLSSDRCGDTPFSMRIENPMTHVVNPGEVRMRILKTERDLESGAIPESKIVDRLTDLGSDYAELGDREKALDRMKRALKRQGRPNAWTLNSMGSIAGEMGDRAGQEKYYLQAAAVDATHSGSLFNLAKAKLAAGEIDEASQHIDSAIGRSPCAPYTVLKAQIARARGDNTEKQRLLDRAMDEFAPLGTLDSFELSWYEAAARMRDEQELVERAQAERKDRAKARAVERTERGVLPGLAAPRARSKNA